MKSLSLSNLYKKTGCLPKCVQTKYKFNLKKSTPIDWRSSSTSSFYLTAESDQVEEQVEYLVYDLQVSLRIIFNIWPLTLKLHFILMYLYLPNFLLFIGPESDHWQCLSVTNSLTAV